MIAEVVLDCFYFVLSKIRPLAADEINQAWGVKKDLQKLRKNVVMMQPLIFDAQGKQSTSKTVQLWLERLRSIARDAEIMLDDFERAVVRQRGENRKRDKENRKRDKLNRKSNKVRNSFSKKIKNVSASLEEAYRKADRIGLPPVQLNMTSADHKEDRLTDPFVDESETVGREVEVSQVVNMLISSDYKKDLPVIAIVGMSGQGKTTLAQLVLKKDSVMKYFDEIIWVCVSDDFKVERLLNQMLLSLGEKNAEMTNREALVRRLQENLKGKRYLLVLDDVWNENKGKWDLMRSCLLAIGGSPGSKILVTTRSDEVSSAMQTSGLHHLDILSDDYSWMLFEKLAFADGGARKTQDLVDIGRRILKRCGGVPLAIKVIGGLLYSKKDRSEWSMIEEDDIWIMSTDSAGSVFSVLSVLKLRYENLPSLSVKQCFASRSIFRMDTRMERQSLIQIWMAQANQCRQKIAKFASQLEQYPKAIEIYEDIARQSLNNNLLKYGVKGHLLNAGICQLCKGDVVAINNALERYQELDPTFSGTREYRLLAAAIDEEDVAKFTDAVKEYDSMTQLDAWKTSLLLRVKEALKAKELEEDDLT